jgi:hypothetical protein
MWSAHRQIRAVIGYIVSLAAQRALSELRQLTAEVSRGLIRRLTSHNSQRPTENRLPSLPLSTLPPDNVFAQKAGLVRFEKANRSLLLQVWRRALD